MCYGTYKLRFTTVFKVKVIIMFHHGLILIHELKTNKTIFVMENDGVLSI